MNSYSFFEGPLGGKRPLGCELSLFNRPEHLELQSAVGWKTFQLVNEKNARIDGVIHFYVEGVEARSPYRSPFGSLEWSDIVPGEVIFSFMEYVQRTMLLAGIERIMIKCPPEGYDDQQALLHVFLLNQGFRVETAELSTLLKTGNFSEETANWEKRKLRQARESGLRFKRLPLDTIDVVYRFIEMCRRERQQSLSMQLDELRKLATAFPDAFVLSGIYDDESLAAASIALRVRDRVLYNFYSGHRKSFDPLSPVVLLMEGLHDYCAQNRIGWIDLGTSALGGLPNFPLLGFKRRLGGVASPKYTFEKILK